MFHDIDWFVQNMGLATRGVDVLNLTNYEVPTQEIEEFFGPKVSKNGYKYNRKIGVKVTKSVLELYKRVTKKRKERRSLITLEDFHILHEETVYQLALAEDLLKVAIKLKNQSSTIGLLKDFKGFVYEMNDIAHV